jgi:hypothetical protein
MRAYVADSVLWIMALIVLATICLLACFFLLFVLVQWMRDTKRKTTNRPVIDNKAVEKNEENRPHAIGSHREVERRDRSKVAARRMSIVTKGSKFSDSWNDERERIAYERIARSFKSGKIS